MRWSEQVASTTGIDAWDATETDLVLDLARDVAHGTERRFAPLTAYAVGLAVGRRLGDAAGDAAARHTTLRELAQELATAATDREEA